VLGGGLHRLGVEVPEHLHVVADEPERHDHRSPPALARQLGDRVVDVGLEPRHLRRTGPALEDELPGDALPSLSRIASATATCCAT
jgi:hypothetical protein